MQLLHKACLGGYTTLYKAQCLYNLGTSRNLATTIAYVYYK